MDRRALRTIGRWGALVLVGAFLTLGCATTQPASEAPSSVQIGTLAAPPQQVVFVTEGELDSVRLEPLPPALLRTSRADSLRRLRQARRAREPEFERPRPTPRDTASESRAYVDADSLSAFTRNDERLQELLGSVLVRQDSTRLRSRRALRFLERSETVFTNQVRIVERGDTLWADTVRYDQRRKIGYARGNVRLTDGDVTVLAPRADYYNDEKYAVFPDTITLVDSRRTLRASAGEYFSDAERAEFYGRVHLNDDGTAVRSDSLTYYRADSVSLAYGDVFIERGPQGPSVAGEQRERTYLFGQRARLESARDYSRVEGQALLIQVRTDSAGTPSDTLMVRSSTMEATRADTLRRLVAVDSVRVWQSNLGATADSTVYDRIPAPDTAASTTPPYEEIRLYQQPITWFEQNQVTGDTIRVVVRNRSIDSVYVTANAFAAQLDTASQRIQQLKGRRMTAAFRNDSLRRLVAQPNAQTVYFRTGEDGTLEGAGQTSGDRIVMDFQGGTLSKARVYSGIQLRSWKGENVPQNLALDGLRWQPEWRPTKAEFVRQQRVRDRLPAFGRPPLVRADSLRPDSLAPSRPPLPYDTLQTVPATPPDTARSVRSERGPSSESGANPPR